MLCPICHTVMKSISYRKGTFYCRKCAITRLITLSTPIGHSHFLDIYQKEIEEIPQIDLDKVC